MSDDDLWTKTAADGATERTSEGAFSGQAKFRYDLPAARTTPRHSACSPRVRAGGITRRRR